MSQTQVQTQSAQSTMENPKSKFTFYQSETFNAGETKYVRLNCPYTPDPETSVFGIDDSYCIFSHKVDEDSNLYVKLINKNDSSVTVTPQMTLRFALATGLLSSTEKFEYDANLKSKCNYDEFDVDTDKDCAFYQLNQLY